MEPTKVITGFLAGLFLVGTGYGDMTAMAPAEDVSPPHIWAKDDSPVPSLAMRSLADPDWFGVRSGPRLPLEGDGFHEPGPSHVLADRQGSLTFCLYALLGLGFLKSVPCARRLPVNAIPAWYHEGGPAEIGQCLAISSGCLYPASIGFVPLPDRADDLRPLYRLGIVAALWRTSQSVPTVLAPRAPPTHSS